MSEKSENRIDVKQHKRIVSCGVCPGCGDHKIITMKRFKRSEDALSRERKYAGEYLCCGGEHAHECWHMTKNPSAPLLYEVYGPRAKLARADAGKPV